MKNPLAALALALALVAPAFAQVPVDKDQMDALKAAMEAHKKAQAKKKADEAKKPKIMADRKVIDNVVDRLSRDGEESEVEGAPGLVARSYFINGQEDAKKNFANHAITLIERPMASPANEEGTVHYTVMRKALISLQATRQTFTHLKDGKAEVVVWTWGIDLEGRIMACTRATMTGKIVGPKTIDTDPKSGGTTKQEHLEPSAPGVLDAWKKMEKIVPFMGRLIEV